MPTAATDVPTVDPNRDPEPVRRRRTARPSPTAEDELVRTHMPLVHYAVAEIAGRLPRHVGRDDLASAGMIGLAQAARTFEPDRGVGFSRYAGVRIRGAILDELRSRDWASRSVRAKSRRIATVSERLTAALGRQPDAAEIAGALGMDTAEVVAVQGDVHRAVVLNLEGLPTDGHGDDIIASLDDGPDAALLDRERQAYLVAAVANLPLRLRRVVIGYFVEELPMHAIAAELGVTDSRISQMRAEALVLLKDAITAQLDPGSLPDLTDTPRIARRRARYRRAVAVHHDVRGRLEPAAALLTSLAATA
jgi:RNA polymerase sigma factor for flagellar operon FliA